MQSLRCALVSPALLHWPSNTSNAGDRVRSCSWCQGRERCQSPLRNE